MNSTNRVLNRLLLLIGGLLLALLGATMLLWVIRPAWSESALSTLEQMADDKIADLGAATVTLVGVGELPLAVLVTLAVALLLVIALVVFIFSRGRGDVREVARMTASDGRTDVDRNVVDAVLVGPLAERPDVLSARTGVYRVKGTRAVRLAVTVRPGASLGEVLTAADRAVQDWDALLGRKTPVLIHLTDRGLLERMRPATRVR